MSKTTLEIEEIKTIIATAIDKLSAGRELSVEDCADLRSAITGVVSDGTQTTSHSDDIDELQQAFCLNNNKLQALLGLMLKNASQGKTLDEATRIECIELLNENNEVYQKILSIAKQELGDKGLPENRESVLELVDAIKRRRMIIAFHAPQEMEKAVLRFAEVYSANGVYEDALKTYRDHTPHLLECIRSDDECVDRKDMEEIKAAILFMQVFDRGTYEDVEGNRLLDSLEQFYSTRVVRGLASGKYQIKPGEEIPCKEEKKSQQIKKPNAKQTDSNAVNKKEETKIIADPIDHLQLADESEYGLLSLNVSPAEEKLASESAFIDDISAGDSAVLRKIVRMLCSLPMMSKDLMSYILGVDENQLIKEFDWLCEQGYLRRYQLSSYGEYYNITKRFEDSLMMERNREIVGITKYSRKLKEPSEDRPAGACSKLALLKLYKTSFKTYRLRGGKKYLNIPLIMTASFIDVAHRNSDEQELFVGIFWISDEEEVQFLRLMKYVVEKANHIEKMVIASVDTFYARRVYQWLCCKLPKELAGISTVLYSCRDDKFCYKDKDVGIEMTELWPELRKEISRG